MVVEAPLIAKKAEPGQFVIVRVCEEGERIPLTISDYDRDEGNWITVAPEKIFRNLPGELNFFVPDSLTEGDSYHIIVRTNYLSKDRSRKETIQTISNSVEVA